jgi:putative DNA primase/helicase
LANTDRGLRVLDGKVRKMRAGEPIDFADPMTAAEIIVREHYTWNGLRALAFWQNEFFGYTGSYWSQVPLADVRERLYLVGAERAPAPVKKRNVDDVTDALRATVNLSSSTPCPSWIGAEPGDPDPASLIPMANGIFDVGSGKLLPASPRLFTGYALPFGFDGQAAEPAQFLRFLYEVFADDEASIATLQEWTGYLLTADTSQQKALLLIGPKRGGKGTIARVLAALLGRPNVVSPTLASLGQPFGLAPLIGKQLAIVSDARLGGHADLQAVAENMLRITGEDIVTIPRKFLPDYTAALPLRFMLLTNEVPRLADVSGALPSRFIILTSSASFYGREDPRLTAKLLGELPGIFRWALAGLERLRERGRFLQPESAQELISEMETLAAPVQAFLADECDASDPVAEVHVKDLFEAWRRWCRESGREHPGSLHVFGRDLRAAMPALKIGHHRVEGRLQRFYVGLRLRGDAR